MKMLQKQKKLHKTTLEKRSQYHNHKFIKKEETKRNQKMVDKRNKYQNESIHQRKRKDKRKLKRLTKERSIKK
jgi:hypothetical protein